MSIELARRALGAPDAVNANPALLKRSLELSAYFTIPKIEVPHRQLALLNAMNLAKRSKNFSSALSFANRILAHGGASKILENVSSTRQVYSAFISSAVLTDFSSRPA
jgi:coatomer protein complex subunit alpha (xenin)